MTLANAIRKMTDEELCEFICEMQITIIRKFAQTLDKELFDGIAEMLKTEI